MYVTKKELDAYFLENYEKMAKQAKTKFPKNLYQKEIEYEIMSSIATSLYSRIANDGYIEVENLNSYVGKSVDFHSRSFFAPTLHGIVASRARNSNVFPCDLEIYADEYVEYNDDEIILHVKEAMKDEDALRFFFGQFYEYYIEIYDSYFFKRKSYRTLGKEYRVSKDTIRTHVNKVLAYLNQYLKNKDIKRKEICESYLSC